MQILQEQNLSKQCLDSGYWTTPEFMIINQRCFLSFFGCKLPAFFDRLYMMFYPVKFDELFNMSYPT